MEFIVNNIENEVLLKNYLRDTLCVSRRILTHLKSVDKGICVNGRQVNVLEKIRDGDIIRLKIEDNNINDSSCVPSDLPIPEIISQTSSDIALNKPAGMPTHPSRGHFEDTLANRVSGYFQKRNFPFVFRTVNRLDSDTSGVVLIALNKYYSSRLSDSLKKGLFKKEYLAITANLPSDSGIISGYISRENESIIKRRLTANQLPGSQYSVTEYTVLDRSSDFCLVKLNPVTGRTHQLRVHLASIGYPIAGDTLYGNACHFICRQALHAVSLSFPSPENGDTVTLFAEPPQDFKTALISCGLNLPGTIKNTEEISFPH